MGHEQIEKKCAHLAKKPGIVAGRGELTVGETDRHDSIFYAVELCVICAARMSQALDDVVLDRWNT